MKRRKICVVTTSRADFGLLSALLQAIRSDSGLRLQVIASGMHLARKFGQTWRDIEAVGIRIDRKIDMRITGESNLANLKSIGMGLPGFGGRSDYPEGTPSCAVFSNRLFLNCQRTEVRAEMRKATSRWDSWHFV